MEVMVVLVYLARLVHSKQQTDQVLVCLVQLDPPLSPLLRVLAHATGDTSVLVVEMEPLARLALLGHINPLLALSPRVRPVLLVRQHLFSGQLLVIATLATLEMESRGLALHVLRTHSSPQMVQHPALLVL